MRGRPNPFRPGAGVDPPYLAGRKGELDIFDGVLRSTRGGNMKNVLLYGLRGVGKTVLLGKFASMCRGEKFLPVARYACGPGDSDPDKFVSGLKRAFRSAIEPPPGAEAARGKVRPAGQRLRPPAAGASGLVDEPSYSIDKGPMADILADYFVKNWKIIGDLGYEGAAILLDEFHMVSDVNGKRFTLGNFLAAVNEAQRQGCRYSVVLSGLPALTRNVKKGRSYAERMFRLVEVSSLAVPDARQALLRPLDGTGRRLSPALVNAVVEDTGCYPYFIQFFAREVLRRIDKDGIGMRDYKSARGRILHSLYGDFFDRRMADLAPGEKNTLQCMATIPDADMRFASILKATGASKGTVSTHLRRLEEKGVVYRRNHGLYGLALPLLRPYLTASRQMPDQGHARGRGCRG